MTVDEIKKEIDRIDRAIFIEHMADFLDWNSVRSLEKEKRKLEELIGISHEPNLEESEASKKLRKELEEKRERHIQALVEGILED